VSYLAEWWDRCPACLSRNDYRDLESCLIVEYVTPFTNWITYEFVRGGFIQPEKTDRLKEAETNRGGEMLASARGE